MDNPVDLANDILIPLTDKPTRMRCLWGEHRKLTATLYRDGYWCFACRRGLDPLGWYAAINNLSLPAALKQLGVSK